MLYAFPAVAGVASRKWVEIGVRRDPYPKPNAARLRTSLILPYDASL